MDVKEYDNKGWHITEYCRGNIVLRKMVNQEMNSPSFERRPGIPQVMFEVIDFGRDGRQNFSIPEEIFEIFKKVIYLS